MKRILFFIFCVFACIACNKEDDHLGENELFRVLERGKGVWKIVSYKQYTIGSPDAPVITNADEEYYEFYFRTEYLEAIDAGFITYPATSYYKGKDRQTSKIEAENERVFLVHPSYAGSWTVIDNKSKRQVWRNVTGNNVVEMTLEKCSCDVPEVDIIEENEG